MRCEIVHRAELAMKTPAIHTFIGIRRAKGKMRRFLRCLDRRTLLLAAFVPGSIACADVGGYDAGRMDDSEDRFQPESSNQVDDVRASMDALNDDHWNDNCRAFDWDMRECQEELWCDLEGDLHIQGFKRIRNRGDEAYFVLTMNTVNHDNGAGRSEIVVLSAPVEGDDTVGGDLELRKRVTLDESSAEGCFSHVGNVDSHGDLVVVAGQQYGDYDCNEPMMEAALFYDFSSPDDPVFMGRQERAAGVSGVALGQVDGKYYLSLGDFGSEMDHYRGDSFDFEDQYLVSLGEPFHASHQTDVFDQNSSYQTGANGQMYLLESGKFANHNTMHMRRANYDSDRNEMVFDDKVEYGHRVTQGEGNSDYASTPYVSRDGAHMFVYYSDDGRDEAINQFTECVPWER